MKTIHALGGALTLSLAACVPQPKSSPPVQTRPVSTPKPAPTLAPPPVNWMDAPQTPGDWTYSTETLHSRLYSSADYRAPDGTKLFSINCSPSPAVILQRWVRTDRHVQLVIRTETANRTLAAPPDPEGRPMVAAVLKPADRLLDAMALSKGRFAVEVAGVPTLYLPSWAEVTRVIEDCR